METTSSRLNKLFITKRHAVLSVFFTAGFPHVDDTVTIAAALQDAGADLIEIGIPFSDPVADGPVIQDSNTVAIHNGMTLKKLLAQLIKMRETVTIPILMMGYLNPVMQYGVEAFCRDFSAAGADGVILPDMPMDVYQNEYRSIFERYGLKNVFLISPTTSTERIRLIDEVTDGFIYAVSSSSTTGAKRELSEEQQAYFTRLKDLSLKNPFLIGFGVSSRETFSKACEYGAGAIVGSAFISMLKASTNLKEDIHKFVEDISN